MSYGGSSLITSLRLHRPGRQRVACAGSVEGSSATWPSASDRWYALAACQSRGGGGERTRAAAVDTQDLAVDPRRVVGQQSNATAASMSTGSPSRVLGTDAGRGRPSVPAATATFMTKLAALHYDVHADGSYSAASDAGRHGVPEGDTALGDRVRRRPARPDARPSSPTRCTRSPALPGAAQMTAIANVARQVLFFYAGQRAFKIVAVEHVERHRASTVAVAAAVTSGLRSRRRGRQAVEPAVVRPARSMSLGHQALVLQRRTSRSHGAPVGPGGPASHGCVRRRRSSSADWIYAALPSGDARLRAERTARPGAVPATRRRLDGDAHASRPRPPPPRTAAELTTSTTT